MADDAWQRREGDDALRAARDPNGPPAFMVYVCPRCALVHVDVVHGGRKVVGAELSADEADAAAHEARAVAGSAFAGLQALSAPRVSAGSLVLIAHGAGQPVTAAVGATARAGFTAQLAPADVVALAEQMVAAAAAARAMVAAADDAYGHLSADGHAAAVAKQVARFSRHGVVAKGCACGHVHVWTVRGGEVDPRINFTPEQAEGVAADLTACAAEARQAARDYIDAAAEGGAAPGAAPIDPSKLN